MQSRDKPRWLPYGRHLIAEEDIEAVCEVLRGDWLTGGPAVEQFESAVANTTRASHAVVCANGTAALHLAAIALDLGPGDWVIVPAVTFLATANAARFVGAEVWFADVDPWTGLMTSETLTRAIEETRRAGKRLRAVFPVHLNGQVADPVGLSAIARSEGLAVVEDACHAIGTRYDTPDGEARIGEGRHATMSAFSFHPVKTVAMGEGGAVTTGEAVLARRLRALRNHGMTRDPADFADRSQGLATDGRANPWYYEMAEIGFNYRASDIHCALGTSQLRRLDRLVAERQRLVQLYDDLLAPLAPIVSPIERVPGCRAAWHLYVVLIDFASTGITRAKLMRRLAEEHGIQTQVHYLPVNRQPYYRARYGDFSIPGADAYYERCLSLPLFPGMSDDDVEWVVKGLRDLFREA